MRGKPSSDISASDDELESEFEDDADNAEGPTIVTVDDGKGGVKQVKVEKPVDSQSEILRSPDGCSMSSNITR